MKTPFLVWCLVQDEPRGDTMLYICLGQCFFYIVQACFLPTLPLTEDSSSEEDGPPDGFQLVQVSAAPWFRDLESGTLKEDWDL